MTPKAPAYWHDRFSMWLLDLTSRHDTAGTSPSFAPQAFIAKAPLHFAEVTNVTSAFVCPVFPLD
jgi:hypothetical protein